MHENCGDEPFRFACCCNRIVDLPPLEKDTRFCCSLFYRGQCDADVGGSQARTLIQCFDDITLPAKETREIVQLSFLPEKEWKRASVVFFAPKATRSVIINLYLDNCGEVFGRCCAPAPAMENGLTARLVPAYFVDNLYCLSSGDPGLVCFELRNEADVPARNPQLVLELPRGINVMGTSQWAGLLKTEPAKREGADAVQYRFDLSTSKKDAGKEDFFNTTNLGFRLMLKTDLASGASATRRVIGLKTARTAAPPSISRFRSSRR